LLSYGPLRPLRRPQPLSSRAYSCRPFSRGRHLWCCPRPSRPPLAVPALAPQQPQRLWWYYIRARRVDISLTSVLWARNAVAVRTGLDREQLCSSPASLPAHCCNGTSL
jgi:hypothetical protein